MARHWFRPTPLGRPVPIAGETHALPAPAIRGNMPLLIAAFDIATQTGCADGRAASKPRETILRKQAMELGLARYFTGVPCIHGHVDERSTKRGTCMQCARDTALKAYYSDIEVQKARGRSWKAKNQDKVKQGRVSYAPRAKVLVDIWRSENRDKVLISKIKTECRRRSQCKDTDWTEYDIALIRKQQKGRCAECRCKFTLQTKPTHRPCNPAFEGRFQYKAESPTSLHTLQQSEVK